MGSSVSKVSHHIPALDGVRGLACLMVVAFHSLPPVVRGGWMGVDVFFVLSGFLITSILTGEFQRHGSINLRSFYYRRALRLLPALLIVLSAYAAWAALTNQSAEHSAITALSVALYFSNWMKAFHFDLGPLVHCWSLSIEEQFYILWPVALYWLLKRRIDVRRIGYALLALAVAVWLYRAITAVLIGDVDRVYAGFDTRCDGLLIGCALALVSIRIPAWAAAFIVPMLFLCSWLSPSAYIAGLPLVIIGSSALLGHALDGARLLEWSALRWVGRLSYGLYLYHYFIFSIIGLPVGWSPRESLWRFAALTAFKLAVSLAVTVASFYLIERPMLRLKRHVSLTAAAA